MAQESILLVGKQSFHTGIDLVGNTGSKVLSVKNGEITYAGWQNGYGNCVEIKHTGDHLHFEIRLEDKGTIDPAEYLFEKY